MYMNGYCPHDQMTEWKLHLEKKNDENGFSLANTKKNGESSLAIISISKKLRINAFLLGGCCIICIQKKLVPEK